MHAACQKGPSALLLVAARPLAIHRERLDFVAIKRACRIAQDWVAPDGSRVPNGIIFAHLPDCSAVTVERNRSFQRFFAGGRTLADLRHETCVLSLADVFGLCLKTETGSEPVVRIFEDS